MSYKFNSILKNSKYLVTSHSSVQATSASAATFVTLSGSEISYTPSENSTKVIYEISFYSEKQGNPFVAAYLQHYVSGSWSEIHNKYRKNWTRSCKQTNKFAPSYRLGWCGFNNR